MENWTTNDRGMNEQREGDGERVAAGGEFDVTFQSTHVLLNCPATLRNRFSRPSQIRRVGTRSSACRSAAIRDVTQRISCRAEF